MKRSISWRNYLSTGVLALAFAALTVTANAADEKKDAPKDAPKPKPYTLDTCIVSHDKLGEMGKPFVFTYKDHEVKMCCSSCKKDFDKDADGFIKKIDAEEAKVKAPKK